MSDLRGPIMPIGTTRKLLAEVEERMRTGLDVTADGHRPPPPVGELDDAALSRAAMTAAREMWAGEEISEGSLITIAECMKLGLAELAPSREGDGDAREALIAELVEAGDNAPAHIRNGTDTELAAWAHGLQRAREIVVAAPPVQETPAGEGDDLGQIRALLSYWGPGIVQTVEKLVEREEGVGCLWRACQRIADREEVKRLDQARATAQQALVVAEDAVAALASSRPVQEEEGRA